MFTERTGELRYAECQHEAGHRAAQQSKEAGEGEESSFFLLELKFGKERSLSALGACG